MWKRPTALVQQLISKSMVGSQRNVTVTPKSGIDLNLKESVGSSTAKAILSFAVDKADGTKAVTLINQSSTTPYTVEVEMPSAFTTMSAQGVMPVSFPNDENEINHNNIVIKPVALTKDGNSITLTLPATSVVVLEAK